MTELNLDSLMKNIENKSQTPQITELDSVEEKKTQEKKIEEQQKEEVFGQEASDKQQAGAISLADQLSMVDEKKQEITLESISIQSHEDEQKKKIDFAADSEKKEDKQDSVKEELQQKKRISLAGNAIIISLLVMGVCGIYKQYLSIGTNVENTPTMESYLTKYQDVQKAVSQYTSINDYYDASEKFTKITKNNEVNEIINDERLSFIQKKDILEQGLLGLHQDVIQNFTQRNTVKQDVAKYKFLPEQLFGVLNAKENTLSIKNLLLSTESIKFASAIKVFVHLETFIEGLANLLNISTKEVQDQMNAIDKLSSNDIAIYLNNCYLNPFELDYDCNTIGDFDKYYQLIDTKNKTDKNFLKKLMSYIDIKLEQTNVPSFLISFSQFNPKQDNITFNLEVNTFKQDEIALANEGILNPHLFIITNLINLFRQSLIIVGENIKTNSIKAYPKTIRVGSTVFNVNSSSLNFTLPIQKKAEREISDFTTSK